MLLNYIKLAFRNLKRNKTFSIISISGLCIGLLSCIMVATVVLDSWSYDRYWEKSEDLYRIISKVRLGSDVVDKKAYSWAGIKPALKENFPEVESVSVVRVSDYHIKVDLAKNEVVDLNAIDTDTLFWDLFDVKILTGQPKKYVHGITNIVLTQSLKTKLFKEAPAVGKRLYSISAIGDKPTEFLVTGVIQDIPANTHLRSQALVIRKGRFEPLSKSQSGTLVSQYVRLKPDTEVKKFQAQFNKWYVDFVDGEPKYSYEFQPIEEVYLNSSFDERLTVKGDPKINYILIGIALLILVIGCVNFINLIVANSISKVKDVGVRKIIGSSRTQIVQQFLVEALMYFAIATILALASFMLFKPYLEVFLGYNLEVNLLSKANYILLIIVAVFVLTLITGTYPAILISGFKSINSLKGQVFGNRVSSQQNVQRVLVVTQFSIALFVLVSLFVVHSQYTFMNSRSLGYNENNLLTLPYVSWNGKGNTFQNEINNLSGVKSSSLVAWKITANTGSMYNKVEDPLDPSKKIEVNYIIGDIHLAETLGLELEEGRFLNPDLSADVKKSPESVGSESEEDLLEESSLITSFTADKMNVTNLDFPVKSLQSTPVGVLKNFHTKSLREELVPTVIKAEADISYSGMLIRLNEVNQEETLAGIYNIWNNMFPNKYFSVTWVDQLVAEQYAKERKLYGFFMFFGVLCLLLASMGVYGLVAQSTQQRVKEIGIRKVLGASVSTIILLFTRAYLWLVLLAIAIAVPVAWYFNSKWLEDFVYRTSIGWTQMSLAALIVLFVALFTVGIQSFKAAMSNPTDSLKTE